MKILRSLSVLVVLCFLAERSSARTLPAPRLVVPGQSVGMLKIGDSQAIARKKIGRPHSTFRETAKADSPNVGERTKLLAMYKNVAPKKVVIDEWRRPGHSWGTLLAIYEAGRVVQIQVSLSDYKTPQGWAPGHSLPESSKWPHQPHIVEYQVFPNEQSAEPLIEQTYAFPTAGFSFYVHPFYGRNPKINSLIVHSRGSLLLRITSGNNW